MLIVYSSSSSRVRESQEGLHIPVIVLTVLCSGKEPCLLFDPIVVLTCLVRR
jgi:hypothetical protein